MIKKSHNLFQHSNACQAADRIVKEYLQKKGEVALFFKALQRNRMRGPLPVQALFVPVTR